ncbi:MAG: hypothetical protein JSW40_08665 [Candidatus Omnitrophota bacterium]|nr:MAG: hypothetical protein JSW40_08665 [Candidatus Omnitrophota bacterium]
MKGVIFFFLILPFIAFSVVRAQSLEDRRRVEEEKRDSLRPSEARIAEEQESSKSSPIQEDYFQKLLSKDTASFSDTCIVLAILMRIEDKYSDFDSQVVFFKERGIVSNRIASGRGPDDPLKKGVAAYMFCKSLGIKGGLWMRLFGVSQRYALRELIFENIILEGNVDDTVSGKELIFIASQAANYLIEKHQRENSQQ